MIEKAIQENTAAIKALIATMQLATSGAKKPAADAAGGTTRAPAPAPGAKKLAADAADGITKMPDATVKSVSDLVLSLVEMEQRATVVKLLKQHGATKVKDITKTKLAGLQKKLIAALKAAKEVKAKATKPDSSEDDEFVDFDEELDEAGEVDGDGDLDFLDE